jgi:hypothetical protein
MKNEKLILGVDNPAEDELAYLKAIQDKHLHVVLVISGCVAVTSFAPIILLYLGLYLYSAQALFAPLTAFQFIVTKAIFVSWIVVGSIVGFYIGIRVLRRRQSEYTLRQAARDYFKVIVPKQIIEDFRKKESNQTMKPLSVPPLVHG